MTRAKIVDLIADAQTEYLANTGQEATHIKLTKDVRDAISSMGYNEIGGNLSYEILTRGIEVALPTLLGLEVLQWDADELWVGIPESE